MSHVTNPDEWLTCPYDKSHRFPAARLQPHILKCKKSHPELAAAFVKCKYNATHLFLGSEIEQHENETCPDRHCFEKRNKAHAQQFENYVKTRSQGENDWLDEHDPVDKKAVAVASIEKKIIVKICESDLLNQSPERREGSKKEAKFEKRLDQDVILITSTNVKREKNDCDHFEDKKRRRTHRDHSKDRESVTSRKRHKRDKSVERENSERKQRRIKKEPSDEREYSDRKKRRDHKHHSRDRKKEKKSKKSSRSRSRSRSRPR
jgi:hypothetical protein